jgi:hypothetical protein
MPRLDRSDRNSFFGYIKKHDYDHWWPLSRVRIDDERLQVMRFWRVVREIDRPMVDAVYVDRLRLGFRVVLTFESWSSTGSAVLKFSPARPAGMVDALREHGWPVRVAG